MDATDLLHLAVLGIMVVLFRHWWNGGHYFLAPVLWVLVGGARRSGASAPDGHRGVSDTRPPRHRALVLGLGWFPDQHGGLDRYVREPSAAWGATPRPW